jgi:hypothetical protein
MIEKLLTTILFLVLFNFSLYCQGNNVKCGTEWINIHKKNPDLVGVYVQQFPDNSVDRKAYVGKHPCMVIFVFKGNKAHQVSYTPTGQVENGFWWEIKKGDPILNKISDKLKSNIYCAYSIK